MNPQFYDSQQQPVTLLVKHMLQDIVTLDVGWLHLTVINFFPIIFN